MTPPKGYPGAMRTTVITTLAVLGVCYAVLAAQYGVSLLVPVDRWWDTILAAVTSASFATGPGSVTTDQADWYAVNRVALAAHMVTGAIALSLAPLQLISPLRRRYPSFHRACGKVVLVAGAATVLFAAAYLTRTTSETVYAGPLFLFDLWGLGATYAAAGVLAYVAIRRGHVETHAAFMVLHIGLLQATPVLRVGWMMVGGSTSWTQAEVSPAIAAAVFPLCIYGPALWLSTRPAQTTRRALAFTAASAARLLGMATFLPLGAVMAWGAPSPITATYATSAIGAVTMALGSLIASRVFLARSDLVRHHEWGLHHQAALLSAPVGAALAVTLWLVGYETAVAVTGGATVGVVVTALGGYGAVMRLRSLL
jgi:hypothetical protein